MVSGFTEDLVPSSAQAAHKQILDDVGLVVDMLDPVLAGTTVINRAQAWGATLGMFTEDWRPAYQYKVTDMDSATELRRSFPKGMPIFEDEHPGVAAISLSHIHNTHSTRLRSQRATNCGL